MPWVHRLISKNEDTLTGVCAHCGPVDLGVRVRNGTRTFRCGPAMRLQRESPRRTTSAHGLSLEEARLLREGKTCAFNGCDTVAQTVDHCHSTGKLRDPLCSRHNKGLGFFLDSPEELRAAISYLERHSQHDESPGL